jgi:hypothetical protein
VEIYVINANLVCGKYQSNQQDDSIAINISWNSKWEEAGVHEISNSWLAHFIYFG